MALWHHEEQITVSGSSTARFSFQPQAVLDNLTIWAVSNTRTIANLTFQPQINNANFGSSVAIVGAVAKTVVYSSGGASAENNLLPFRPATSLTIDPFTFSVLITNADASPATVTLYAVAYI